MGSDCAKTVAVLGARGQLGRWLVPALRRRLGTKQVICAPGREALDLCDGAAVRAWLQKAAATAVVNAAAYTAVDRAEEKDEAKRCWAVNHQAVVDLAHTCGLLGARLVHISTDYVYVNHAHRRGATTVEALSKLPAIGEDEPICPAGEYACSKAQAERTLVNATNTHTLILRVGGLYAPSSDGGDVHGQPLPPPRNFAATMLALAGAGRKLRVVNDQWIAPSFVPHLSEAIAHVVCSPANAVASTLLHIAHGGRTTWYDFARALLQRAGMAEAADQLEPISTESFGAAAPRPPFSVLCTDRYHALPDAPPLPSWEHGLDAYFEADTVARDGRCA